MSLYQRYYRTYGLRLVQHLVNPPIHSLQEFELPRDSVYHYLPDDTGIIGMPSDHLAVRNADRLVMVEHVEELSRGAGQGNPRKTNTIPTTLIRDYHRRHRKLKLVRNLSTNTRDPRTLLVVNYALLPELYRYTQSVYSHHYQLSNIETTLWENLVELDKKIERHHIVPITLPVPLPSLKSLRRVEETLSRMFLSEFASLDHLLFLSLWRWLGEHREKSAMAKLDRATLDRTHILLRHENHWMIINLGKLDKWRDGLAEDDDGDLSPVQLQRRFLRMMMTLFEQGTSVTLKDDEEIVKEQQKQLDKPKKGKEEAPDPSPEQEKEEVKKVLKQEPDDEKELDEELDALNDKQRRHVRRQSRDIFTVTSDDPLRDGIMERANELAEEGLISAAEYRRFEKISEVYKELPDPRTGKGKLAKSVEVKPEDVKVEPVQYPDSITVPDKSMLQSTLHDFDRRYVKEVLPKDVSNAVLSVNRAGVAVTKYEVEEVNDVANHFEIHTVKVTPVQGKPSTIRFRLPVIQDDGTYMANGVRYRMRRQRGD